MLWGRRITMATRLLGGVEDEVSLVQYTTSPTAEYPYETMAEQIESSVTPEATETTLVIEQIENTIFIFLRPVMIMCVACIPTNRFGVPGS